MRDFISFLTVCIVMLSASTARAQLIKHFDRTFGGTAAETWPVVVVPTADGGCLFGGSSSSGADGDKSEASRGGFDYWVIKADASGNKQWDRTLGGSSTNERLFGALQTQDGGYVLVGWSDSGVSGDKSEPSRGSKDYWVIRLDPLGNKLWDKTLGGPGEDKAGNVLATSDGGYLVWGMGGYGVGDEKSFPSYGGYGGWDYWVVKIDADGNKEWDQLFGGSASEEALGAILLLDGTFVLGGSSASGANGNKTTPNQGAGYDYWIIAIDADGNKLWERAYGGGGSDKGYDMVATSDGGFAIAGTSTSGVSGAKSEPSRGGWDLWLVKADALGNKQWDRTVGTAVSEDQWTAAVVQTDDGGFLIGGASPGGISGDRTEPSRGSDDYWVVRLDSAGKKLWDKALGGSRRDALWDIARGPDGGYWLAGQSGSGVGFEKSESRGSVDFWFVKTFELSALAPTVSGMTYVDLDANCSFDPAVDSALANRLIQATPGPFLASSNNEGQFTLRLPGGDYTVEQAGLAYSPYAQTCPGPLQSIPVTAVIGSLTPAGAFGNEVLGGGGVDITTVGVYPPPLTSPCPGQANEECVTFLNNGPAAVHDPRYTVDIAGVLWGAQVLSATATASCNCIPTVMGNHVKCEAGPALPVNGQCTICVAVSVDPPPPSTAGPRVDVTSSIEDRVQSITYGWSAFQDPILCSSDPNDRTLLRPGSCGEAGFVPSGRPLVYRTRFQNLGNAPAHNVVIDETLDDALDPATFQILGSDYDLTRAELFPGNRLLLSFIGIELPPAESDLLGSVGTVVYSIRPKASVANPRPIRTRAAIYFDLNEPVITNETLNTVIDSLPPVSFAAPPAMCLTDPPVALSGGMPAGGTYSGDGVTGGFFDPAAAGVGAHAILYSYAASIADPSYTLNQVGTFAPLPGSGVSFSLGDGEVSADLPIGFTFNFYGNDYTQFRLSSNGFITFNATTDSGGNVGAHLPNAQPDPSNLIAFAWDDLLPLGSGAFNYFTTGAEPNRVLVVNAVDVALCCGSIPKVTSQILLYEGTNVIEIHTTMAASNNGMTMGITSDGGAFATVVPGRNSELYSITNDFVQFIPPASASFCSDEEAQTIVVNASPVASIMPSGPTTLCPGEAVTLTASGGTTYAWSTGPTGPTLVATSAGIYSVLVTDEHGCTATADMVVSEVNPGAVGVPCVTDGPGVCADGTTICADGVLACAHNAEPSEEVCDGLDNDCDGQIDEDAGCDGAGAGGGCGAGGCGGTTSSSMSGAGGGPPGTAPGAGCGCEVVGVTATELPWPLVGLLVALRRLRRRKETNALGCHLVEK